MTLKGMISNAWDLTRAVAAVAANEAIGNVLDTIEHYAQEDGRGPWGNPDDVLDSGNDGFSLGSNAALPKYLSARNFLAVGGSGSGKSSLLINTTLLNADCRNSFICHDPEGSIVEATAGAMINKGYSVYVINANNPTDSLNALDFIESDADVDRIANSIVKGSLGMESNDPFWSLASIKCLKMLICLVIRHPDRSMHTMSNVVSLLKALARGSKGLDAYVVKYGTNEDYESYVEWLKGNERTGSSILMSLSTALQVFSNPNVRQLCDTSTIRVRDMREKPCVIYLQNASMTSKLYAPLLGLYIEMMMAEFMRPESRNGRSIYLLLDETPVLASAMPSLSTFVSNARKANLCTMIIAQSTYQLFSAYGRDDGMNILSNCFSRLYLPSAMDLSACKELEESIGPEYYLDERGRRLSRPAITATELRALPQNTGILFTGGYKPFLLHDIQPYYKDMFMLRQTRHAYRPAVRGYIPAPIIKLDEA